MKTPLVSVYITNHNYGKFIDQSIKSVLGQTLTDFELIIIDDGSTDNSKEIIESYASLPGVITIFQKNKGLNVTNNIALRTARGKYIVRLDADDYLDENALKILADTMERDPEIGLVFPDYYHVSESGEILEIVRRHDFEKVSLHDQPAHGACTMIRKKFLEELGGYDESYSCQDGYYLWMNFVEFFKVKNVNLPLFFYRQHGSNLTRNETRILKTRSEIVAQQNVKALHQLSAMAIIPVRGPSIDPGSIALRKLAGKPFLNWTIDAALDSTRTSSVVVTTPDPQIIAHIAEDYGDKVTVVYRDRHLAAFNTTIEDAIDHTLKNLPEGIKPCDVLVILYPDAPFRSAHYINTAINLLELFGSDSVVAVRQETHNVFQHNGCGLVPVRKNQNLRLEWEELLRDLGRMRVVRRKFFEENHSVLGGQIGHIILDQTAAFNVTSEWDWQLAELVARNIDLFRPAQ